MPYANSWGLLVVRRPGSCLACQSSVYRESMFAMGPVSIEPNACRPHCVAFVIPLQGVILKCLHRVLVWSSRHVWGNAWLTVFDCKAPQINNLYSTLFIALPMWAWLLLLLPCWEPNWTVWEILKSVLTIMKKGSLLERGNPHVPEVKCGVALLLGQLKKPLWMMSTNRPPAPSGNVWLGSVTLTPSQVSKQRMCPACARCWSRSSRLRWFVEGKAHQHYKCNIFNFTQRSCVCSN